MNEFEDTKAKMDCDPAKRCAFDSASSDENSDRVADKGEDIKCKDCGKLKNEPSLTTINFGDTKFDIAPLNESVGRLSADIGASSRENVDVGMKDVGARLKGDGGIEPKNVDIGPKNIDIGPKNIDIGPTNVDINLKYVDISKTVIDPTNVDINKTVDIDPKNVDIGPKNVCVDPEHVGIGLQDVKSSIANDWIGSETDVKIGPANDGSSSNIGPLNSNLTTNPNETESIENTMKYISEPINLTKPIPTDLASNLISESNISHNDSTSTASNIPLSKLNITKDSPSPHSPESNITPQDLITCNLDEATTTNLLSSKPHLPCPKSYLLSTKPNLISPSDRSMPPAKIIKNIRKNEPSQDDAASDEFVDKLNTYLKEENLMAAKALIRDKANASLVASSIAKLIPVVIEYVNGGWLDTNVGLFDTCVKILKNVSKIAEPHDLIFSLIEQIVNTGDDETFLSVLKPLQTGLLRLQDNMKYMLVDWSLYVICEYLLKLPAPQDYEFDEDEALLMDADPFADRLTSVYIEHLPFYDPLIAQFRLAKTKKEQDCKNALILYISQILDEPFACLDLEIRRGTKSRARRISDKLMENLELLNPDFYALISFRTETVSASLIGDLPLSVVFYMALCEKQFGSQAPKVYDPIYIFQNALNFVVAALQAKNIFSIERGLRLAEVLLELVKDKELSYRLLDSVVHCRLIKALINLMVYYKVEDVRKKCLALFQAYLRVFETRGRYLMIYNIMQLRNVLNSNVIGFIIVQFKYMLDGEFARGENSMPEYYKSHKLLSLLRLFWHLEKGEESDLFVVADQLVSVLNLLRYVLARDKKHNVTGIWDYIKEMEDTFLAPLKRGLILSRAHYEVKINEVKKEKKEKDKLVHEKKEKSVPVSVKVGGAELQNVDAYDEIEVLKFALTTFDVIESVLSCVTETIDRRRH